jgi:hypothetical protein
MVEARCWVDSLLVSAVLGLPAPEVKAVVLEAAVGTRADEIQGFDQRGQARRCACLPWEHSTPGACVWQEGAGVAAL